MGISFLDNSLEELIPQIEECNVVTEYETTEEVLTNNNQ